MINHYYKLYELLYPLRNSFGMFGCLCTYVSGILRFALDVSQKMGGDFERPVRDFKIIKAGGVGRPRPKHKNKPVVWQVLHCTGDPGDKRGATKHKQGFGEHAKSL